MLGVRLNPRNILYKFIDQIWFRSFYDARYFFEAYSLEEKIGKSSEAAKKQCGRVEECITAIKYSYRWPQKSLTNSITVYKDFTHKLLWKYWWKIFWGVLGYSTTSWWVIDCRYHYVLLVILRRQCSVLNEDSPFGFNVTQQTFSRFTKS